MPGTVRNMKGDRRPIAPSSILARRSGAALENSSHSHMARLRLKPFMDASKTAQAFAHVEKFADAEMRERAGRRKLRESARETALTARCKLPNLESNFDANLETV
jgi:hypothetical protein